MDTHSFAPEYYHIFRWLKVEECRGGGEGDEEGAESDEMPTAVWTHFSLTFAHIPLASSNPTTPVG